MNPLFESGKQFKSKMIKLLLLLYSEYYTDIKKTLRKVIHFSFDK